MSSKKTEAKKPADTGTADQGTTHQEAPQAAKASAKVTPVTKLSVKTVCGTPVTKNLPPLRVNLSDENPDGEPNPAAEVRIMRVAGYATGNQSGSSTYGQWRALTGEFVATNLGTGELFASKSAILPGPMNDMLYESIGAALREDASASMAVKVDVFVKRSARDVNKYEYTVRPVIEAAFASPALALLTAD